MFASSPTRSGFSGNVFPAGGALASLSFLDTARAVPRAAASDKLDLHSRLDILFDMQGQPIHDASLDEAVRRLVDGLHPRAIVLFGSRARGNHRTDSDHDLLVISERRLNYDEVYRPVVGRGLRCDVVPCTLDAWRQAHAGGVLRDALEEGIVLYGQP